MRVFAVCALIINPVTNKILGVSRKDNFSDFGLPGGKVDLEDPTDIDALKREVLEETGLNITDYHILYSDIDDNNHLTTTYLCKVSDYPETNFNTEEKGVVKWIDWDILFNGSFGEYNKRVRLAYDAFFVV